MCNVCQSYSQLSINVRNYDPTRTQSLRKSYETALKRRFNNLKRDIRTAIIQEDVFGLTNNRTFQTLQTNNYSYQMIRHLAEDEKAGEKGFVANFICEFFEEDEDWEKKGKKKPRYSLQIDSYF